MQFRTLLLQPLDFWDASPASNVFLLDAGPAAARGHHGAVGQEKGMHELEKRGLAVSQNRLASDER